MELLSKICEAGELRYFGRASVRTRAVNPTVCHIVLAIGKVIRPKNLSRVSETKSPESIIKFVSNQEFLSEKRRSRGAHEYPSWNFLIVSIDILRSVR